MSSKAAASWAYALARTLPVPRSGLMSEAVWKLPGREIWCVFFFFLVANVGRVFGSVTDDASVLGFFPWA